VRGICRDGRRRCRASELESDRAQFAVFTIIIIIIIIIPGIIIVIVVIIRGIIIFIVIIIIGSIIVIGSIASTGAAFCAADGVAAACCTRGRAGVDGAAATRQAAARTVAPCCVRRHPRGPGGSRRLWTGRNQRCVEFFAFLHS
jgi:hypothetical protein